MRSVTVSHDQSWVEVHIEGSGPLKPQTRTYPHPERIVINLPDVHYYERTLHIPVNAGNVQGVRVSLFQTDPPVTRVVVDMARPCPYHLLSSGNTLTVRIDAEAEPTAEVQPAPPARPAIAPEAGFRDGTLGDEPPRVTAEANPAKPAEAQPAEPAGSGRAQAGLHEDTFTHKQPALKADARPEKTTEVQPVQLAEFSTAPRVSVPEASLSTSNSGSGVAPPPGTEEATTVHQAAKEDQPLVLRSVSVSQGKGGIEVHIEGSGPLQPEARALPNPERIVIDLANVRSDRPRRIPVNAGGVEGVNVSLFLLNPLVTRIVVDLSRPLPYHLLSSGNLLTVTIGAEGEKTTTAQPVR